MAISGIEYSLFRSLREQDVLPLGGDILEIGQANWYGDVDIRLLAQDICRFVAEDKRQPLFRTLDEIAEAKRPGMLFEIAGVFWQTFLQPGNMTAIDLNGREHALKLDLNDPIDLKRQFHLVMNLGTVEHVFNVAQAFRTIHNHTLPGGFMIHGLPFTGWVDHGFFNFNPTFYWDVASANGYDMVACIYAELKPLKLARLLRRESILELVKDGQIGQNSLIYVVMRKPKQFAEFRVPIQGYYAGAISAEAAQAWKTLR